MNIQKIMSNVMITMHETDRNSFTFDLQMFRHSKGQVLDPVMSNWPHLLSSSRSEADSEKRPDTRGSSRFRAERFSRHIDMMSRLSPVLSAAETHLWMSAQHLCQPSTHSFLLLLFFYEFQHTSRKLLQVFCQLLRLTDVFV